MLLHAPHFLTLIPLRTHFLFALVLPLADSAVSFPPNPLVPHFSSRTAADWWPLVQLALLWP